MRIAYFSPLPPSRTGIGDYSAGLLPSLANLAQIDLWVDAQDHLDDLALARFNYVRDPTLLSRLANYDAVLYHLGNSPFHVNIYEVFFTHPGVVVLHDFVLHHFFAGYFLNHLRAPNRYVEEMEFSHGIEGRRLAEDFVAGKLSAPWEREPFRYPLNKRVIDNARGIIVHSRFARDFVRGINPSVPVRKINLFANVTRGTEATDELRRKHRLPLDKVIVASLGFGTPSKRLTTTLRALKRLRRDDVIYLIVGEIPVGMLDHESLQGITICATGYVKGNDFTDYLNLIDICVNLRWPTMGETSATVCRVLGAGKACIVSDVGWFSELPEDCVVKVPVDDHEEEALAAELADLIEHRGRRSLIGHNARRYIAENHRVEAMGKEYVEFLSTVEDQRIRQGMRRMRRQVLKSLGAGLARMGVKDLDVEIIEAVATRLAPALKGL